MTENSKLQSRFDRMLQLQGKVFDAWIARVKVQVNSANDLASPTLIDTLPLFYKHLAALVTGESSTYDQSTISSEHGGERARLTRLDAHSVAHELHLFRSTALEVWSDAGIDMSPTEVEKMNVAIDIAIRDSISGFMLAQTAFREQFFAALTHDLRSPLSTATMALELITGSHDYERNQALAGIIGRQHALMARMIDDLLETMVMQATAKDLTFDELDLKALSDDIVQNALLSGGREITVDGPSVAGQWCEPALRRAMENLLNNAIKYSESGSPIHIEIERFDGRVAWSVTNCGPAIPADQVEGLFQLFRRAERAKYDGTTGWGIGLPYVRSVAERHAGSIIVSSNDQHTKFTIDIPTDPRPVLAKAQQLSPSSMVTAGPALSGKKKKIKK